MRNVLSSQGVTTKMFVVANYSTYYILLTYYVVTIANTRKYIQIYIYVHDTHAYLQYGLTDTEGRCT